MSKLSRSDSANLARMSQAAHVARIEILQSLLADVVHAAEDYAVCACTGHPDETPLFAKLGAARKALKAHYAGVSGRLARAESAIIEMRSGAPTSQDRRV